MEEWIPYNNFFTRLLLPYHQISLYKFSQKDKNQKVGLIIFDPTDSEIIFFNHKFSKKWQPASHIVACLANIWKKQWLFRGYELRWHVNCESVIGCERQVWGIPWRSRDSCGNWKWQNAFRLYIFFLIINIFFGFNFFFFLSALKCKLQSAWQCTVLKILGKIICYSLIEAGLGCGPCSDSWTLNPGPVSTRPSSSHRLNLYSVPIIQPN